MTPKSEVDYELELLIGILSFRSRTKQFDHYRKELEGIILPFEEKNKNTLENDKKTDKQ